MNRSSQPSKPSQPSHTFDRAFWSILALGLFLRLVSAMFSYGYGMHDDHFVIEDGPYRWELPDHGGWFQREGPPGHSVVYPAILYAEIQSLQSAGVSDPKSQMTGIRLTHALWSVIALPFIWLIGGRLGGRPGAIASTLLFAVLWVLPFMSVRSLIEMMALPPLMMGWWYVIRNRSSRDMLLAGFAFAVAFSFRYHTSLIPMGLVLSLWLVDRRSDAWKLVVSVAFWIMAIQGTADYLAWGYPMAGPLAYVSSNLRYDATVPVGHWYTYPALLLGVFLPPASIIWTWWAIRRRDKEFVVYLVLPLLVFLGAHMVVANQQERFVLPIIGALSLVFGVTVARQYAYLTEHGKSLFGWKTVGVIFLVINLVMLVPLTISESKSARVDVMYRLRSLPDRDEVVVVRPRLVFAPTFYAGHSVPVYQCTDGDTVRLDSLLQLPGVTHVVCLGTSSRTVLDTRIVANREHSVHLIDSIVPKGLDQLLYRLNPRGNRNETSYIYSIDQMVSDTGRSNHLTSPLRVQN